MAPPAPPPPAGSTSDPSDAGGATSVPEPPDAGTPRLFDSKRFRLVDGRLVRLTKAEAARDRRRKESRRQGAVRVAIQRLKVATPAAKEQMAAMAATGMSPTAIGRAFGVDRTSIQKAMSAPEMVATIEKQRAFFRAIATEQAADVILDTFGRIKGALENDDPKAFDAYTRGLAALERTGASASGENKPASVNVAVGVQTSMSAEERAELLREFRRTVAIEGERG